MGLAIVTYVNDVHSTDVRYVKNLKEFTKLDVMYVNHVHSADVEYVDVVHFLV